MPLLPVCLGSPCHHPCAAVGICVVAADPHFAAASAAAAPPPPPPHAAHTVGAPPCAPPQGFMLSPLLLKPRLPRPHPPPSSRDAHTAGVRCATAPMPAPGLALIYPRDSTSSPAAPHQCREGGASRGVRGGEARGSRSAVLERGAGGERWKEGDRGEI